MKVIDQLHLDARLINEIDDILELNIKPKYSKVIIQFLIEKWRDAI